jgi:hypothetical protein
MVDPGPAIKFSKSNFAEAWEQQGFHERVTQ